MKRFTGILSILAAFGFVSFLTMLKSEPKEREEPQGLMQVHITAATPEKVTDRVTAHGQVTPRWKTTLSSEVSGRVLSVSHHFLTGKELNKGEVLAVIDPTAYMATFKAAKFDLAKAQRTLKEEQQRAKIAADNWKASGFTGNPSDLVLRKPQLAEAKAAHEAAKADLAKAKYFLAQTNITMPYDGVVVERVIHPGEVLQMGSKIGRIYNRSLYDVFIPLSQEELARLPQGLEKQKVTIRSVLSGKTWEGKISRLEQVIDPKNRWQNAVVTIAQPKGLLPGEFVTADFTGISYAQVLSIPEDFPADNGQVWYVDEQDTLQRFTPDILFRQGGMLFIRPPFEKQKILRITKSREVFLPQVKVEVLGEKQQ